MSVTDEDIDQFLAQAGTAPKAPPTAAELVARRVRPRPAAKPKVTDADIDAYLSGAPAAPAPPAAPPPFDPHAPAPKIPDSVARPREYLEDPREAIAGLIKQNVNQPGPIKPPLLAGDTPRLTAPDSPEHAQAVQDALVAGAEHAETPEQQATRRFEGFEAGTQQMVPFFPRVRGYLAGKGAEYGAAFNALAGKEPENTDFARMQASYLERKNAQRQIEGAANKAPVEALMGNVAMGAVAPAAGPLRAAGATSRAARVLDSTLLGGSIGASAADRPGVTNNELAAGFGVGAGFGTAGGLVGEGTRLGVRGASSREDKAFMRELIRTDGGEGVTGILAKNKEGILRDYKNIVALRRDPEIREAAKMTEGKGVPIINEKIRPYAEAQGPRYDAIDEAVAHPFNQGAMNGQQLLDRLEAAKGKVSAEAADKIGNMQERLKTHWLGRVWGKDPDAVIPSDDLREWLTDAQTAAANTPGSLNWTNNFKSTTEATRAAKKIFNDYLDGANLPEVAEAIRRDNVPISTLSTVRGAMEAKAKKEALQSVGLDQVVEKQNRGMERTAALATAFSGHPVVAAGILGKPYAEKAGVWGLRHVNSVLDSMNLAAEQGATRPQLVRFAIERGVPQGLANAAAEKYAGQVAAKVRASEKPTGDSMGAHAPLLPLVTRSGND